MLKEHGDDWILHLDPQEKEPGMKAFNSRYNRDKKRKRDSTGREQKLAKKREEAWQERMYTEPEERSDEPVDSGEEIKDTGPYTRIGRKYLEAHGWREGDALGREHEGHVPRLVVPLQVFPQNGNRGLGFDDSPHVLHVSRIVRPLDERFISAGPNSIVGHLSHDESTPS